MSPVPTVKPNFSIVKDLSESATVFSKPQSPNSAAAFFRSAGARGGERKNPNAKVGNFRNEYVYVPKRPSPSVASTAKSVGEGSSTVNAVAGKFSGDVLYRLYFKGLVGEESVTGKGKVKMADVAVAGFGVAICDQRDGLLFELKRELVGRDTNRQGA
ncbi:hypothetical protein Bca101_010264 [Brassica carinata]